MSCGPEICLPTSPNKMASAYDANQKSVSSDHTTVMMLPNQKREKKLVLYAT